MHELGIAQNVLEIAQQHVSPKDAPRVRAVRVRVGPLSGVVADSLVFCFEAIVRDSEFPEARIVVDPVPLSAVCTDCGKQVESDQIIYICPHCSTGLLKIEGGNELRVSEIELDDQPGDDQPEDDQAEEDQPEEVP